jgi:hypothetical protein
MTPALSGTSSISRINMGLRPMNKRLPRMIDCLRPTKCDALYDFNRLQALS